MNENEKSKIRSDERAKLDEQWAASDVGRAQKKQLEAALRDLDEVERLWLELPEETRAQHQELSRFFATRAENRHRSAEWA